MKNLITLLLAFYVFLTLTSCANSIPPSELEMPQEQTSTESQITTTPTVESIEFFGETYLIDEADYIDYDEEGSITFVLFHNIGFIGLADKNKEPVYQQVKSGQVIGGATVAVGTSMGFDFINGKWELTESDVSFTGSMTFIGELTKTPEGELQMFAPGTLTFIVTESKSGFVPFKYGFDNAPQFMLDGYDPEVDYPELFEESDTVYVKATFDWIRLLKTDRATGVDRAKLVGVELIEPVKTQSITFPANDDDGETEFNAHIYDIEPFDVSLLLPDDWSLGRFPLAGGYDFITVFSRLNFFNEKKECVGVVGYNIYELYEGAENNPMAIYGQIAIGNNYQFNVKNSYNVVNETDSGTTAIVDVYYAAVINDGVEKNNKGIVSYNKDLLVYIAAEFSADKITDEQLTDIAKSIQISRNS